MNAPISPDIRKMHQFARAMRGRAAVTVGRGRRPLPALVLVTDEIRLADPVPAAYALPPGSAVLLRHYGDPDRAKLAEKLAEVCQRRGLKLWIAADTALAKTIGAHGLHLPEHLLWRPRPPIPASMIVATSAHSPMSLRRSHEIGADAALLAPVFPTASHPGQRALGPLQFAQWVRAAKLPVYALGGVTAENAGRLTESGAVGIAAIGGLAEVRR